MRYLSILIIILASTLSITAQVIVESTNFSLGDVKASDEKHYDFRFTNASNEAITIENVEEPYGVRVRLQNKTIKPDSSVIIRVKYTPKRKGEFSVDIPVSFSSNNQPILLTLSGKAVSFDASESMEPPPFVKQEKVKSPMSNVLIEVVNINTGEPIPGSSVDIIWDGVIYETLKSNSNGLISKRLEQDSYYLIGSAPGYSFSETDVELTVEDQKVVIELTPSDEAFVAMEEEIILSDTGQALQDEIISPPKEIVEDTTEAYIANNDTVITEKEAPKKDTVITKEVQKEVIKEPLIEKESTSSDLPEHLYADNNIVFLIDISVSMRSQGKLDLLKASMIELASLLRPTDKLAIVTYSSQTNLVLHSISASNKEKIIKVIQNLEAGGKTSGAKGVKKAYKVLNNNYISGGNNQIFISTDGAFNIENKDKKLIRTVKKNAKKGNKISVLGIKNKMWTVKNMEKIARVGNGNYIHIQNYQNAKSSLINEIKKQSALK